eukprot:gene15599-21078_t
MAGGLSLWNGLSAGVWTFLFSFFFMSSGYICLCLSIAEMTSLFPFSGGMYGFARITLGSYLGFLVGCTESFQNIVITAGSIVILGQLITETSHLSRNFEPIYYFFTFLSIMLLQIVGGKSFWALVSLMGILILLSIILYYGSFMNFSFDHFALNNSYTKIAQTNSLAENCKSFMLYFPFAAWYYAGVESLPLACRDAISPKTTIPSAQIAAVLTLFIISTLYIFAAISQSPGLELLSESLSPLSYGYDSVYKIGLRWTNLIVIPITYASIFGFIFSYGRQICAMTESGLFHKSISSVTNAHKTPYVAILCGSFIAFVIMLVIHFQPASLTLTDSFNLALLSAFVVYCTSLICFLIFRSKFSQLQRNFVSPLGVYGAWYGLLVFSVGIISITGFQDSLEPLYIFIGFIAIMSAYYYYYVRHHEYYSEDEQSIMMVAYVINANTRKKYRKSSIQYEIKSVKKTSNVILPLNESSASMAMDDTNYDEKTNDRLPGDQKSTNTYTSFSFLSTDSSNNNNNNNHKNINYNNKNFQIQNNSIRRSQCCGKDRNEDVIGDIIDDNNIQRSHGSYSTQNDSNRTQNNFNQKDSVQAMDHVIVFSDDHDRFYQPFSNKHYVNKSNPKHKIDNFILSSTSFDSNDNDEDNDDNDTQVVQVEYFEENRS